MVALRWVTFLFQCKCTRNAKIFVPILFRTLSFPAKTDNSIFISFKQHTFCPREQVNGYLSTKHRISSETSPWNACPKTLWILQFPSQILTIWMFSRMVVCLCRDFRFCWKSNLEWRSHFSAETNFYSQSLFPQKLFPKMHSAGLSGPSPNLKKRFWFLLAPHNFSVVGVISHSQCPSHHESTHLTLLAILPNRSGPVIIQAFNLDGSGVFCFFLLYFSS